MQRWSKEEENKLLQLLDDGLTYDEICTELKRTRDSVERKMKRLNIADRYKGYNPSTNWNKTQVTILKRMAKQGCTVKEIADKLNKSEYSIVKKAKDSKVVIRSSKWSKREEDYLEKHYVKKTYAEIGEKLGRSEVAVRRKANEMNLSKYFDVIYIKTIARAFKCNATYVKKWVEVYEMPIDNRCVDVEQFWKWAYNNKEIIPFQRYECGSLIPEPSWVKEIVRERQEIKNHRKRVTEEEVKTINSLYALGNSVSEIAVRMGRTENGIKHILKRKVV